MQRGKHTAWTNQTNVTSVTMHHLKQEIWRAIRKHTGEKNKTNVTNATMNHLKQAIYRCIWERTAQKKTKKCNQYNYASIEEGTLSTIDVAEHTLHYWLRPFEGVQFRFDNLGSHFILVQIFHIYSFNLAPHFTRIQIFQIDFEETKWTFLNFF